MTVHRWERERSAHLLAGSRPGTDRRRKAELLARRARRHAREGTGVAASVQVDEITPSRWMRVTTDADGRRPLGRQLGMGLVVGVGALVAGAGIAAGCAVYRALATASPRIGRLWTWPWAAAGGLLAAVLVLAGVPFGFRLQFDRRFPVSLLDFGPAGAWLAWQAAIALITVAWLVWAWGWAGVPAGAVAPPERNRDGSFRATPERHKVRLDHDDDPAELTGDEPLAPTAPAGRRIPLADLSDVDDDEEELQVLPGWDDDMEEE